MTDITEIIQHISCDITETIQHISVVFTEGGSHAHNNYTILNAITESPEDTVAAAVSAHEANYTHAESVFYVNDLNAVLVDTIIDWINGPVQVIRYGAIINLSFTGWEHLAPTEEGKAQSGTLVGIDGDLFPPTHDGVNQGPLPTYIAGFANVQELASLGPDGVIYNMWQVSNDQHVLLGSELWKVPATILDVGWIDNGDGTFTCDGTNDAKFGGQPITPILLGEDIFAELEYITINAGSIYALVGNTTLVFPAEIGIKQGVVKASASGTNNRFYSANFNGTVKVKTIKRLF